MTTSPLVDRLAALRTFADVPAEQLQWLVSRGFLRQYAAGDIIFRKAEQPRDLWIVLSGLVTIRVDRGGASRIVAEWRAGDITGVLPYSRMTESPGTVTAEEASEVLMLNCEHFPEMIRDCHEITSLLVHVMLDRARYFRSNELHDEKMRSLGQLAAGLAHELNNPASAVARSSRSLAGCLAEVEQAASALGACDLSEASLELVQRIRDACLEASATLSPLERIDREETIAEWLQQHQLNDEEASAFVGAGIEVGGLETLASRMAVSALPIAFRYLAAICDARRLVLEIETAASRIHGLVTAVKGFTYMDQATVPGLVDVGRGLSDTITVLRAKARAKKVDLSLNLEPGLPGVDGFGGELNQVWSNLIDNALDAVSEAGRVAVSAVRDGQSIVVRVVDNGPGIPEEIRERIFDPFFTTKRIGEGTGLGLEIARRLVERHRGAINVSSGPGGSEFRVSLPVATALGSDGTDAPLEKR